MVFWACGNPYAVLGRISMYEYCLTFLKVDILFPIFLSLHQQISLSSLSPEFSI